MNGFMDESIRRAELLREWRIWVNRLAGIAREVIGEPVEVYVVGSIVRGDYTGGSDVDVLIVSPRIPDKHVDRAGIKVLIEDRLKPPYYHPLEIHLLKPGEAEYYFKRAGRNILRIL